MHEQLLTIPSWRGFNNPWMAEDDQDVEFSYINLADNPERYTGYKVCPIARPLPVQAGRQDPSPPPPSPHMSRAAYCGQ